MNTRAQSAATQAKKPPLRGSSSKSSIQKGLRVEDIPKDQILPDPHQPRTNFKKKALEELRASIKSQGLQQYPVVQFAFRKDGKDYYYIKAGERRWRAHMEEPRWLSVRCVVEEGVYDGKRNVSRRLAQAAENSSREPHTHGEIIELMEEVIREEIEKQGRKHGAVQAGQNRVAEAFGKKSQAWAASYHALGGLVPELRAMLDEDEDGVRLNFSAAVALARAPADTQLEILAESQERFEKGGHAAGYAYIVRRVREIRQGRGEKVRGRGSDEKAKLVRTVERFLGLANGICGERRSTEYKKFVEALLSKMSTIEVDGMLSNLKLGLQTFEGLLAMAQKKRDENYKPFSIAGGR